MAVLNTLVEEGLWRHWSEYYSEDVDALISPSGRYSWAGLDEKITQYASLLHQQGIGSHDVISVIGKNSELSVFIFLASLSLGASVAFIAPQTECQLLKKFETLYREDQVVNLICPDSDVNCELLKEKRSSVRILDASFPVSPLSAEIPECKFNADRLASLIFTSGSTGEPKAVAHTSLQHLYSADGLLQKFHFSHPDCWLLSLPLYHVSGLSILYRWMLSGATLKIGMGSLSSDINGVTHASLVTTQLQRLLDSDVSLSLTHVLLGGSDIPVKLSDAASASGIETWVGYGMTEAASTVTAKRANGECGVGAILPNRQFKLEDGRIWIGGKTLASGYYRQGQLTPLTTDGKWFDSKDLGEWQSGELVIKGRVDNQFISGGENVHCEEIESALVKHPHVLLAMIIPVNHKEFGARPVALVRTSCELEKTDYEQWLKERLEKFKWPVEYYPLPDSLMGQGIKLSRPAARKWLMEQYPHYQ
ncbi:o-succinylbenzoate--CoA ligase [Vibrio salinus]|uniref:o-succinylbenzoate--CoA ligase n=1 Tax=Vibrio salinus TaxID=2899784 RepID=UPI001E356ACD|nr:o-succinylbenzoate--CoA ligase [Vibrio salinus]MCE0494675.1 o-succinylbenzoate--CoA ligase [Vibrio salinus]